MSLDRLKTQFGFMYFIHNLRSGRKLQALQVSEVKPRLISSISYIEGDAFGP